MELRWNQNNSPNFWILTKRALWGWVWVYLIEREPIPGSSNYRYNVFLRRRFPLEPTLVADFGTLNEAKGYAETCCRMDVHYGLINGEIDNAKDSSSTAG